MVQHFSNLPEAANAFTRLEVTAVATVSLMCGVVLGGLVAMFSQYAARGLLVVLADRQRRAVRPTARGGTRPGRHRVGRVPVGTH